MEWTLGGMDLLALDEVQRRLRIVGESCAGVRAIEVGRIVGSLDRSSDFDRAFTVRHRLSVATARQPARGLPGRVLPADRGLRGGRRVLSSPTVTADADFDSAARDANHQHVSRRFRKDSLREKSSPLQVRE